MQRLFRCHSDRLNCDHVFHFTIAVSEFERRTSFDSRATPALLNLLWRHQILVGQPAMGISMAITPASYVARIFIRNGGTKVGSWPNQGG